MSRVYLICGRICSGKTFLARQMEQELHAVRLSVDETMLAMKPDGLFGTEHDQIAAQVQRELYEKSVHLVRAGTDVILDWGFWTKESRQNTSQFYQSHQIPCEWHYIDISEKRWERNILNRNHAIQRGEEIGFVVDEGLREKAMLLFEVPSRHEMDVWHSLDD